MKRCWKKGGIEAKPPVLCDKGVVTHGALEENSHRGGPGGKWEAISSGETDQVSIADFLYVPGDLSTRMSMGIPTVKLGGKLTFTNFEGGLIWHTVTSCKFPCLGPTGAAYPISDGRTSLKRRVDFDSSEVGFGTPEIGPPLVIPKPDPSHRYRRPYEGTDVKESAMQAYLDWEYGLVEQLRRDATHGFFVI